MGGCTSVCVCSSPYFSLGFYLGFRLTPHPTFRTPHSTPHTPHTPPPLPNAQQPTPQTPYPMPRTPHTLPHPPYTLDPTKVSNLGMFDISEFIAVLNPPQSTIFAVGRRTF
jgi:hypothetical protein